MYPRSNKCHSTRTSSWAREDERRVLTFFLSTTLLPTKRLIRRPVGTIRVRFGGREIPSQRLPKFYYHWVLNRPVPYVLSLSGKELYCICGQDGLPDQYREEEEPGVFFGPVLVMDGELSASSLNASSIIYQYMISVVSSLGPYCDAPVFPRCAPDLGPSSLRGVCLFLRQSWYPFGSVVICL